MFVGWEVTEEDGVVSVQLIPLKTYFFSYSGLLLIYLGGFYL